MTVVKLKTTTTEKQKPPRAAIRHLKEHPEAAGDFDKKYGNGAAHAHLFGTSEMTEMMGELLEAQALLIVKLEELVDVMRAPRQAIFDADGNVAGSVSMTQLRLDEHTNEWYCAGCGKAPEACICDDAGGELIKA